MRYPFVDGTVEGTNVYYPDTDLAHDHTYYGNGCQRWWDSSEPHQGGSITACETREVETEDNETLLNGTYYHASAAFVGSYSIGIDMNTLIPDTFCPLGWQLPYSGTGGDYYDKSKSWRYLITEYNIPSDATGQAIIRSYPFSYVKGGVYYWHLGALWYQNYRGHYWGDTKDAGNSIFTLGITNVNVEYANTEVSYPSFGNTLRCVPELATRIVFHGIRVHSLVLWLFIF